MNNNIDIRLIYEWNTRRAKLDFAVKEVEHQLASVKKRLKSLRQDLIIYSAFLAIPLIIYLLLGRIINLIGVSSASSHALLFTILLAVHKIVLCVYVIFLPFNICHFIRTIILVNQNKESDSSNFTLPPLAGTLKSNHQAIPEEASYRSEYNKLMYVLTRYYMNQDIMDELYRQINSDSCTLTLADLKLELNKLPFYEDIRPANTFPKTLEKQDRSVGTLLGFIISMAGLLWVLLL